MAKRKKPEPDGPPGVPAWMATFSDLVTLLLTFFVMLMAMASFDDSSQLDTALESIRDALGEMGFGDGLVSMVVGENLSDQQRKADLVKPQEIKDRTQLEADLSPTIVKIAKTPTEVRLTLDEPGYFDRGQSTLRPAARRRVRALGLALAGEPVGIRVEGHTDTDGDENSNWELSALRAVSVLDVLNRDAGIPRERLQARGYGPSQPRVVRPVDQALNRRIEIVLIGNDAETTAALEAVRTLEVQGG